MISSSRPIETVLEKTAIIILAAGGSTRLGAPKQLLKDKNGVSFLKKICTIALSIDCQKVYCILGAYHESISKELEDLAVVPLVNAQWDTGLASSLHLSIVHLSTHHPDIESAVFLVCDQPFISKLLLETIVKEHASTGKPIVACHYQHIMGTPALFARSMFPELLKVSGDRGAGTVIKDHAEKVALVEFKEGIFDIDTTNDYELYLR